MSRQKKQKHFATEVDLCAAFIRAIPDGWTPYAETAGWDILMVRNDGFQVGIQAKLKLNAHVMAQALDKFGEWDVDRAGPDCRAIMVPWGEVSAGLEFFCAYLGITIIRVAKASPQAHGGRGHIGLRDYFSPQLPGISAPYHVEKEWHEQCTLKRHKLPDYVPDVAAGAKSPTQLSQWKIKALKICIIMERQGYLTRADFKAIQMDHRRWLPGGNGWLKIEGGRYIRGSLWPKFREQHPNAWKKIEADYEQWRPKPKPEKPERAPQPAML